MKLLEKILVATDFDNCTDQTVQTAVSVAKVFNSEIVLLHVIPEVSGFPAAQRKLKDKVTEQLQGIQREIEKDDVRVGETTILSGVPFDQITRHAARQDVNVIILGAGEKSDDDPYRLGITAERVIRKSSKPVWVSKQDAAMEITNILCPVDYSDPSARALTNAIRLARSFQAKLTVLNVIRPLTVISRLIEADGKAEETYLRERHSQFEQFLEKFDFYNVNWSREIRQGPPHQEILTFADEIKSDLLVMGSVGRTGLSRILMGSVASKIVRQMPCSVITVKSEHAVRLRLSEEIRELRDHLKQGQELLEKGFAREALKQFEHCLAKDILCEPAWKGKSVAHQRLGQHKKSKECDEAVEQIRRYLWRSKPKHDVGTTVW